MKHFVYKTTNLVNGKYYIGKRSAPTLSGTYLGSGTALKAAIRKYGRKNFKRVILKQFSSSEEAYNYEAKLVSKEQVLSKTCYNLTVGGRGSKGVRVSSRCNPVIIEGVSYPSQRAAAKALKVSHRMVGEWVKGNSIRGAKRSCRNPVTYKGKTYPTIAEAARQLGVPRTTLNRWLKN